MKKTGQPVGLGLIAYDEHPLSPRNVKADVAPLASLSLEQLCEGAELGGLPLSKAQRALTRAANGLPVDLTERECFFHFGRSTMLGGRRPKTVIVRCGRASGKSLVASMAMTENVLVARMRWKPSHPDERPGPDGLVGVRPGEFVRSIIMAPTLELTKSPMAHIKGTLTNSERLYPLVLGDLKERVDIKRPDGVVITMQPVAASAAGTNVRSTWFAGVLFDEADFYDDKGAAVNLLGNYRAVVPRMLENGQIWIVSSPIDDSSEFNEMFTAAFGENNGNGDVVAFHSDSISMNPSLDRVAIAAERARDPENAAREFDAVPLSSSSNAFFPLSAIMACCKRPKVTLPPDGSAHWAGADLGFSKNSSALALARHNNGKTVLAFTEELSAQPGQPLSPKRTCKQFGKACIDYSAMVVRADHWDKPVFLDEMADLRAELGRPLSLDAFTPNAKNVAEAFAEFRRRMIENQLDLWDDPKLIQQLQAVKTRRIAGGIGVELGSKGRDHSDLLMAVVLACIQVPPRAPGHVERGMLTTNPFPF